MCRDERRAPVRRSVFVKVVAVVRRWLTARGVPPELYFCPPHLAELYGLYNDPKDWPSLFALQHDEKDVYRAYGPNGLQDWGDGECERLEIELKSALDRTRALVGSLRAHQASALLTSEQHASASRLLLELLPQLERYTAQAVSMSEKDESHADRLARKKTSLGAGQQHRHESLSKHIAELNRRAAEVHAVVRRSSSLSTDVRTRGAAQAAPVAASVMAADAQELLELLDKAFSLANKPCSKALAMMMASVMDVAESCLGALYFTCDEANTWQMREAVHRCARSAYERGMVPLFVGADKAYMGAAHWDLDGYAKTRTAAKREVEFLTALLQRKTGLVSAPVKHWPRTRDLR